MADVTECQQEFRAPIRLEARARPRIARVDEILIAIQPVAFGMCRKREGYLGQCVWRQQIVVIEEHEIVAVGGCGSGVGRLGYVCGGFVTQHADPRITTGKSGKDCQRFRGGASIIDDHQFPVLIPLLGHALDRREQPFRRSVQDGHQDRKERSVRQLRDVFAQEP